MSIKRILKRIIKSTIFTFIGFLMASLILVLFISFIFWVSIISADPWCYGVGTWIHENPCPTWIVSYKIPSFIDIFVFFSGMYFGMIFIVLIVIILINYHQTDITQIKKKKK